MPVQVFEQAQPDSPPQLAAASSPVSENPPLPNESEEDEVKPQLSNDVTTSSHALVSPDPQNEKSCRKRKSTCPVKSVPQGEKDTKPGVVFQLHCYPHDALPLISRTTSPVFLSSQTKSEEPSSSPAGVRSTSFDSYFDSPEQTGVSSNGTVLRVVGALEYYPGISLKKKKTASGSSLSISNKENAEDNQSSSDSDSSSRPLAVAPPPVAPPVRRVGRPPKKRTVSSENGQPAPKLPYTGKKRGRKPKSALIEAAR